MKRLGLTKWEKESAALLFCIAMSALFFNATYSYAATPTCTEGGGENDYWKNCSVQCQPGDLGYSVDITIWGNPDAARIDGIGWVDPGTYGMTAQCVNGAASGGVLLYFGTQSAGVEFGDWVAVRNSHVVTAATGTGGSINPATITVDHGQSASFTITPDTGYAIRSATGCGGALFGNIYTTSPVTGDCTVNASFTTVACTEGGGDNDYWKNCSVQCQPGDWGYSVAVTIWGNPDAARIDGIGWVDPGTYGMTAQCVNGAASGGVLLYFGTQSAGADFGYWAGIPQR